MPSCVSMLLIHLRSTEAACLFVLLGRYGVCFEEACSEPQWKHHEVGERGLVSGFHTNKSWPLPPVRIAEEDSTTRFGADLFWQK